MNACLGTHWNVVLVDQSKASIKPQMKTSDGSKFQNPYRQKGQSCETKTKMLILKYQQRRKGRIIIVEFKVIQDSFREQVR
jgi:hypothetical protein